MTNLHILSDPVIDFRKCPKKVFFLKWFFVFFKQNFSSTFCHQTSSTCHTDTTQSGIWSESPPDTILLFCYCTVLYCIILYCTVLYLGTWRAPKSPPEELEVGGRRPPYLLVPLYFPILSQFPLNSFEHAAGWASTGRTVETHQQL